VFDDNQNEAAGYWFNFSDFDSTGVSTDKAKGSSVSSFDIQNGDQYADGSITLHAVLNKMIGTKWHDYSGWASIGTNFENQGYEADPLITGIKFHLKADTLDPVIEGISFKVALKGEADTATHLAFAPAANILAATGDDFCARPEDLLQPDYVKGTDRTDFDPSVGIKQLAWEAKIQDNKSPSITTGKVKLTVSKVEFYGITAWNIIDEKAGVSRKLSSRPFSVSYANGALNLKGFDGVSSIDVLSIDGRKIASFAPQASVSMNLARGTYFLSAKKSGATTVQSFSVVGR